ncbi:MAG TPA: CotH kinase family protein [Draconibacterium sp.]|nr:CotH kinase family protein [Draconibacterium sp.]
MPDFNVIQVLAKHLFFILIIGVNLNGTLSAQSISSFSTDLPLLIIDTNGKPIYNEPKTTGKLKIVSNSEGLNHFTDPANDFDGTIGIELRGSSSQGYPQKPYLFETRNSDGTNLNVSILGLPEENDWVLLSNYNDKSFMRNILGYQLFERLGHYAPRAKLVDVILNNEYQGIYILTEKIKRDKNRVDIANLKEEDIEGEELTGGYIFKIDYWNNNDSWESPYHPINHSDLNVHFVFHDPDWDELVYQQKNYLENYVTSFETALYSSNFTDETQGYPNFIDVNSFIDYFLVSEVSRNNDGFKKSRYFHKDKNGKIMAGPVWDFDWAWKNINECYIFKATDGSGWAYKINDCHPDLNSPGWMIRLFYDEKFKNEVNCRYFDLRTNIMSDETVFGMIDSLYNEVKNAQIKHFQKWKILGQNVGAPEIGTQPATYEGEVEKLKDWIATRFSWLDKNMLGKCATVHSQELAENSLLKIYPNPAKTVVNIMWDETIVNLQIFDLTGKTVYINENVDTELAHIEVSTFPPGIYILKISNKNGNTATEKIVVN